MEALRPWDAFALRPLTDDDLPLLRHWLEKPHVRTWFEHPDHWLREARQRRTEFAWIRHFIALCGQTPVGFCQYYPYARGGENWHGSVPVDGSYSIDYLVGDETSLRRGLGARMVLALIRILRDVPDAPRVSVRPDPAYDADNQLFILCPLHAVHDAPHRATPALQGKTSMSYTKEDVYRYHSQPRPGKLEVLPTKPSETQDDLTLAYSPGVADACRAIQADPAEAAREKQRQQRAARKSRSASATPKPEKVPTHEISYRLLRQGLTREDIARERRMTVNTITRHLARYIQAGDLTLDEVLSPVLVNAISSVLQRHGLNAGYPILSASLPGVDFNDIRLVASLSNPDGTLD